MTESRFRGLRTFIVDMTMVLLVGGIAAGITVTNWQLGQPTDPDILWTVTLAFGAIAGKGAWGKLQAGKQEIEKIQARS